MMKIFYILIVVVVVCIELFSEKIVYLNKPDICGVCVCIGVCIVHAGTCKTLEETGGRKITGVADLIRKACLVL